MPILASKPNQDEDLHEKAYGFGMPQNACKLAPMNSCLTPQIATRPGLAGISVVVHQGAFSRSSRSR